MFRNGYFSFSNITPNNYQLVAYLPGYLKAIEPIEVTGDVYIDNIALLTGDISKDNQVDLSDLIILRSAYGTFRGGDLYHPDADLNDDGRINIVDLVYLARNYSKTGYGG